MPRAQVEHIEVDDVLEAPKLVLEVLSDATEPVDRRAKLLSYRRLDSLEAHVLIDQNKPWVEVYRRTPSGWMQDVYEAGDVVRFAAVDLAVPLDELYAGSGIERVKVCPPSSSEAGFTHSPAQPE